MIYRQNFTFYQKKTGFAYFAGAWRACLLRLFAKIMLLLSMMISQLYAADARSFESLPETVFPVGVLATNTDDSFSLSAYEGALLINFWATWCAPCVHELPALSRAAQAFAKQGTDIKIVLISVDRKGGAHAQAFLDERGITHVISAYDPKSTWARALGLKGLPSTYLISADRQDIFVLHGPAEWDEADVMRQITELVSLE